MSETSGVTISPVGSLNADVVSVEETKASAVDQSADVTSPNPPSASQKKPETVADQLHRDLPKLDRSSGLPILSYRPNMLPSRGLDYPKETTISIKPYDYGELISLSQSRPNSDMLDNFSINIICEGVTIHGDLNQGELTIGDTRYLGVMRRLLTLSSEDYFTVGFPCPVCGAEVKKDIKYTSLEFDEIDEKVTALPVTITLKDGSTLKMAPLKVAIFRLFEEYESKYNSDLLTVAGSVASVGKLKSLEDCRTALENALKRVQAIWLDSDIKLIEQVDNLLFHSDKDILIVCPDPQKKHPDSQSRNLTLPIEEVGSNLLIPFPEPEGSVPDQIKFG